MYIGIDLGGTNIAIGIVDADCNIICKDSVPTGRKRPYQEIVRDMAELIEKLMQDSGYNKKDIEYIGLGSPGYADSKKGEIIYASSFPTFRRVPLAAELNKYFPGVKVFLENDANTAAYGEFIAGAAKGLSDVVAVTLGTGVGGGVIIDGKIYSGSNHAASELGHKVIAFDGLQCECGRRGCWEVYASVSALIRQTKEAAEANPESLIWKEVDNDLEKVNGKTVFDAAHKGDETAKKVIDQYIKYIVVGVADVVNVFQPEAIIIGGGISKQGEELLSPIREAVDKETYGVDIKKADIIAASLGNDAGIIGAAMLWKQKQ